MPARSAPVAPKTRGIRLTTPAPEKPGDCFCVAITDGGTDHYLCREQPCPRGRQFEVRKENEEDGYFVVLDGPDSRCSCKGCQYRGTCRHIQGINALIRAGKLTEKGSV